MGQLIPLPINPPPGVVVTESQRVAEGRWVLPYDKMRFVHGRPQKIGGNKQLTSTAMSGTPRATLCWQDFLQNGYVSCGTYRKLYAFDSSYSTTDITPFSSTGTLTTGPIVALGSITNSGSGYTNGTYTAVPLTGGTGTLATATLTISSNHVNNAVISAAGRGDFYTVADSLGVSAASVGGTGSGFAVNVGSIGPFTSASGSATIAVSHKSHGRNVGDTAIFAASTAFNGVTMNGTFIVSTVVDSNHYTVPATTTASGTGPGGGNATTFSYEVSVGTELGAFGQGWGTGQWGLGTWGTARGSSTIFFEPRVWSLSHFGQVLVASYNGGSLWFFDPTQNQPWPRAVATFGGNPVNGAPTNIRFVFVSPERFVFALSAGMVVNVCSQGDPTTWTPATNNTAFARTLQEGSKLVAGISLQPFISMIWTDAAAYLFQYTGSTFIYNSSLVGRDCGLISPNGAVTVDGIAYWMGADNFYVYNGAVGPMPNVEDIRKYVYDALPDTLAFQTSAVYVPKYHEIWFFYPTTGNTNPSNYVIFHINDQCWSVGTANFHTAATLDADGLATNGIAGRASGDNFSLGDTSPILAGNDGQLYNHDYVGDVFNDNGAALTWTLTLSPYAMQEGLQNVKVESVLFDFFQQVGNVTATVNTYDRLTDTAPMDTETEVIPQLQAGMTDMGVSGRYISLGMSSSDINNYVRLGKPVAWVRPIGHRK